MSKEITISLLKVDWPYGRQSYQNGKGKWGPFTKMLMTVKYLFFPLLLDPFIGSRFFEKLVSMEHSDQLTWKQVWKFKPEISVPLHNLAQQSNSSYCGQFVLRFNATIEFDRMTLSPDISPISDTIIDFTYF